MLLMTPPRPYLRASTPSNPPLIAFHLLDVLEYDLNAKNRAALSSAPRIHVGCFLDIATLTVFTARC